MDYRFFEDLTEADARAYLATFLEAGQRHIATEWWDRLTAHGIAAIEPYFAALVPSIRVVQVAPPVDLPSYIVESMQRDHGGFRDFASDADREAVLAAGFYFGEGFRRSFSSLSWAVGRGERAEEGQPVVTGFRSDADLPVLEVAENLVLGYERDPSRVATAIATWKRVV